MPQNLGSAFVPKEAVFNKTTVPPTRAIHPRPPHCMKAPETVPKNSKSCMALDLHFFEGLTRFPSLPLSLEKWLFGSLLSLIVDI